MPSQTVSTGYLHPVCFSQASSTLSSGKRLICHVRYADQTTSRSERLARHPRFVDLQRVEQIEQREAPGGQFGALLLCPGGGFLPDPDDLCSKPFWRRRVGPVPGGHRSGRRLMPGNKNKALQPVAGEHWLRHRAGYQVHFLLPHEVSGCYPVEESFSGMPEAFRRIPAVSHRFGRVLRPSLMAPQASAQLVSS